MAFGLFRKRRGPVIKTEAIGLHWDVEDPFVFCVRHEDVYPKGNDQQAPPLETIAGRNLGHDYKEKFGFRMYQGKVVPGFPRHPHYGTETITWIRKGHVDFSDTSGCEGRCSDGDVHWLAAGSGIHHCEMFPLDDEEGENVLDTVQIWLNQTRTARARPPEQMVRWNEDAATAEGDGWTARLIAGSFPGIATDNLNGSWAADPGNRVCVASVTVGAGSSFTLPQVSATANRNVYILTAGTVVIGGVEVPGRSRAKLAADEDVTIEAPEGCEFLLLEGEPMPEKTVSYGPFFAASVEELRAKQAESLSEAWGEWPWEVVDRVHPRSDGRFFKRPDGTVERPEHD